MSKIVDIVAGRADWVLDVRVLRLWVVPDQINSQIANSVEMLLLDKECGSIHANVKRNLLVRFHPLLEEGSAYHIERVMVSANDSKFPTTSHKYKLKFMTTTTCTLLKESDIPTSWFVPVPFPDIKELPDEGKLIDVIGHIVERGDLKNYERNGRTSSYIQFVLEDTSRNRLPCTFWGTYADDLQHNLAAIDSDSPPILLIQLCKVKTFKGVVGVSNSFHCTKVYFNSDITDITNYRQSISGPSSIATQTVTRITNPPQVSLAEEMLQAPRLTIADLIDSTAVGVGVVTARIMEIETQHGWFYNSCNRCFKKVSRVGTGFYCKNDKCSRIVTAVPRYKVEAKVIDSTGCTTFVMINRVASTFLGKSVEQLMESTDPDAPYPPEFRKFLERELLFKVEILEGNLTQNWQQFAVRRMTSDPTIIEAYIEKFPIAAEHDMETISFADTILNLPQDNSFISLGDEEFELAADVTKGMAEKAAETTMESLHVCFPTTTNKDKDAVIAIDDSGSGCESSVVSGRPSKLAKLCPVKIEGRK